MIWVNFDLMSDEEETICVLCNKSEAEDKGGEVWIECSNCKKWMHCECAGVICPVPSDVKVIWLCKVCEREHSKSKTNGNEISENGGAITNKQGDEKKTEDSENEDHLQLKLIGLLIKEKEELCAMKQKQLDLMERVSQKEKRSNVTKFVRMCGDVRNKPGTSKNVQSTTRGSKFEVINPVKPRKSINRDESCDADNDVMYLMRRQMQLMSQQYLADLPDFDGDADMWPIFHQQFVSTTEQAGFDDAFNLMRLRKCLKGDARQAVIGILAMPNCLQDVMTVLEKRFGSNEVIVKKKLKKLTSLAPPNENKPQTVKQFYEFLLGFNATLRSTNAINYLESPQTLDMVVDKLPPNITRSWLRYIRDKDDCITLNDFLEWFEPYYDCANECDKETPKAAEPSKRTNSRFGVNLVETSKGATATSSEPDQCRYCRNGLHNMVDCEKFKKLSTAKRWLLVRRRGWCFNCLLGKHRFQNCGEKQKCNIEGCEEFHHKLLHRPNAGKKSSSTDENKKESVPQMSAISSVEPCFSHYRCLPVTLINPENDKSIVTWALLDEGSSPSMLSDDIANMLELEGECDELCTTWTDESCRKEPNSRRVKLLISGVGQKRKFLLNNVRTVSKLKLPLPTTTNTLRVKYQHLHDVEIPDVPISRPTILIGLSHSKLGLMYEIREGRWDEPVATRTRLGWVIHGNEVNCDESQSKFSCFVCECGVSDDLSNMMRAFHSTESFGVKVVAKLIEAKEDIRAREVLKLTSKKKGSLYETGLLWRRDDVKLPESKHMALKRLMCFEQKLNRDEQLKIAVQTKMAEHIKKEYLVKLSPEFVKNMKGRHWYLPIFSVQNPNKPGKPRLVFDAAAKSNDVCLNDMLLKGPEMIVSLLGVIMRFRLRKIAVTADIEEMFHRVKVIEQDQLCQLVLWRNCESSKPVEVYKMTRMTFGATCSPCSAHFIKDENAKKYSDIYPRAVEAIIRNHYVDNLLESFETIEEALKISQQIYNIHAEAGFNLRDWVSNSTRVCEKMNASSGKVKADVNLNLDELAIEKILGMFWAASDDEFVFKVNFNNVNSDIVTKLRPPTKREVLKATMSQFDPLGILSPVIVHAKILMQETWKEGVEWDDKIPIHLHKKWFDWLDALDRVKQLRVRRCYFQNSVRMKSKIVLHMFADASEEAYAAVAYLHVKSSEGTDVSLVAAKSRVAPQKALSIPRLELQAAVLSTRLKDTIVQELAISIDDVVLWTDSQTALGWIRSTTRKYSAFVSHRVSEILDTTNVCQWRWLPGKQNVADEATRATDMPIISERWLNGPSFLSFDENFWPTEREKIITTDEEVKQVLLHCVPENIPFDSIDPSRFSRWERMLRCVAFTLRFIEVLKKRRAKRDKSLTVDGSVAQKIQQVPALTSEELNRAEKILYKKVQSDSFAAEIQVLSKKGQPLSKKSNIYNLNPILDDDGILRLASRIESAPSIVSEDLRRPIILCREHRITSLLIDAMHRKFHHLNKESVVNQIRQQVWIPKIRVQVNKVVRDCNFCKIRLAKPRIPMMAPLAEERLAPFQPAFDHTGIDFFGPIEVTVGRRHEKRWGVLFVCLTMRAIHLEVANSLDTNSALMCVRNFVNRRGPPTKIVSDNGTNLRAAEKELKKAVEEIDFNRLQEESVLMLPNEVRTVWKFIPPSAPHFGGSWERMIQTVKKSLYIILKERYPKDETLRSALIEIENLVNSRPLCYSPNNVDNPEAITPNHLIKRTSRQVVPLVGEYNTQKQWRVAQALATDFWQRWLHEYLPTISRRSKWYDDVEPLRIGQVVLIIDDTVQRGEWRRGVIPKVYPSKDGKIRSAEVTTVRGTYMRPVAKLAIINIGPIL